MATICVANNIAILKRTLDDVKIRICKIVRILLQSARAYIKIAKICVEYLQLFFLTSLPKGQNFIFKLRIEAYFSIS